MNILSNKKRTMIEIPVMDKKIVTNKLSEIMSWFVIIFLAGIVVIMSMLISNFIYDMKNYNKSSIVYEKTEIVEEPKTLIVNF